MDIKITKKGQAWFNTGHPWVYKDDLEDKQGTGLSRQQSSIRTCPHRAIVDVVSESNKFLAKAFYNPYSQIALRIITRKEEDINKDFWARCIKKSIDYRKPVVKDTNAYRLVFSEADALPGLVADIYGDVLVIQITSLGMEIIKDEIAGILNEIVKPKTIVLKNDLPVRKLEGLKEEKAVIFGEKPDLVEAIEGGIKYLVDVWEGHKTGAYLDQRENRFFISNLVPLTKWNKVLDAFCYQGLFSLHLARHAGEVIALDSSKPALDIMNKNLELNHIKNVAAMHANAFDKLKEFSRSGEKFDMVVLDPPPFAKSKREIGGAKRGYKDLNLRAIQCLNESGYLATFSCSYNFSEEEFLHSIRLAASDAKRDLYLVAKLTQSKDHPICVTFPESNYLKGFVFRVR